VSLPTLSAAIPSWVMLKLPTGVGRPGSCSASGFVWAVMICAPAPDDDPGGLRIGPVAGVAGRVEKVRAVLVVQDRGAAVVSAIRIGFREVELSRLIDLRHHAEIRPLDGIGRIDDGLRIGVRDVECINRAKVAHKGHEPAIGRQMRATSDLDVKLPTI